jgi:tripeptide aminopeptidase
MFDVFSFAATSCDCEVETEARKDYRGYRFKRDDDVVVLAAAALARCGYEPTYALSGGAADANVFNESGRRCVNLDNGMTDIHTPDERIEVEDLGRMIDVTLALLDEALAG